MTKVRPPRAHEGGIDLFGCNFGKGGAVGVLYEASNFASVRQDDGAVERNPWHWNCRERVEDVLGVVLGNGGAQGFEPIDFKQSDGLQLRLVGSNIEIERVGVNKTWDRLALAFKVDRQSELDIAVHTLVKDALGPVESWMGVDEADRLVAEVLDECCCESRPCRCCEGRGI